MMRVELAILDGEVVTPRGRYRANVGVSGGKIVAVTTEAIEGAEVVDARGLQVLPGLVDCHVHFRDPAYTEKEDFTSGTRAAAKGGITTVLEMPTSDFAVATVELFERRRAILEPKAVVDFAMYGAAGTNPDDIPRLAEAGVVAFKTFLCPPHPGREQNWAGTYAVTTTDLLAAFRAVASTGRLSCVHAEDRELAYALYQQAQAQGLDEIGAYLAAHPTVVEIGPLQRAIRLAREAGARLHVIHITSAEGIDLVLEARARGQEVSMEVVPLYLFFSRDEVPELGPMGRLIPGVKQASDREALWKHLARGDVDVVASDHAAFSREDILGGFAGQGAPHAGYASIEHDSLLMLTQASRGRVTLERLVEVMSERPARLYGLYPRKGAIQPGADADLTLVDLQKRSVIRGAEMESKSKFTIYEGWEVLGMPVRTIVRGKTVMRDGQVVGQAGDGQLVRPVA
jgi:allantoinase